MAKQLAPMASYQRFSIDIWPSGNTAGFKILGLMSTPKKGVLTKMCNFKSISLTSAPGEVQEMVNFLETNNLINTCQHGFCRGRFCITDLLNSYHYVFSECDWSRDVEVFFYTSAKAFDMVPHKSLMKKIRTLSVFGNLVTRIENWLARRRLGIIVKECVLRLDCYLQQSSPKISFGTPPFSYLN